MDSTFGIIIDLSNKNSFNLRLKLFIALLKYIKIIDIIDVSKILKKNKIYHKKNIKSLRLFRPKNISQLKEILSKKKYILLYCLTLQFKYFKINLTLSNSKIKLLIISNLGYNPNNYNYYKLTIVNKIIIFFKLRLKYFVNRFLIFLNILPKIDYFFESSEFIIKSINNGYSKKIEKLFPFIKLSFYKKLIKINSRFYDEDKNLKKKKYIVFVDGMPMQHPDRILRDGYPTKKEIDFYYLFINQFLKKLKKQYKKKIIVCLHPKNQDKKFSNEFKYKTTMYETEKYISNAFMVIFHEGSSIVQAILLKKKIITVYGDILGKSINQRCLMYSKILGNKKIEISTKNLNQDRLSLNSNLSENEKIKYNKYIKHNIIFDKKYTSTEQVLRFLQKNENLVLNKII